MAKQDAKKIERTYNIPLRKEFMKVPNWKKTKKAVTAVKQFLAKHMKSEDVKLGTSINEKIWKHGIKNPPHHVKVTAMKDEKGSVKAELFGVKIPIKEEKKAKKTIEEAVAQEEKKEAKEEKTDVKQEAPQVEEKVTTKAEEKPAQST